MKAGGTGLKVSLLAFPRRKLWTYSKIRKVVVGGEGALSLQSYVTGSPTQLRRPRDLKETLRDWKLLWQRGSRNTEESQGLERRHPPVSPFRLTGKVAPPTHKNRSWAPAPARRSTWTSGGGRPLWPEAEILAGRRVRGSPSGRSAAELLYAPTGSALHRRPPTRLSGLGGKMAAAAECDVVMAATEPELPDNAEAKR